MYGTYENELLICSLLYTANVIVEFNSANTTEGKTKRKTPFCLLHAVLKKKNALGCIDETFSDGQPCEYSIIKSKGIEL